MLSWIKSMMRDYLDHASARDIEVLLDEALTGVCERFTPAERAELMTRVLQQGLPRLLEGLSEEERRALGTAWRDLLEQESLL